MTREEEIAVAFYGYRDALKLSTFGDFEYINIQEAFEEGAKWADNHPVNVWHDASEEPKEGEWILVMFDEGDCNAIVIRNFGEVIWRDWCKKYNISHWAYISEMLPKGGKK